MRFEYENMKTKLMESEHKRNDQASKISQLQGQVQKYHSNLDEERHRYQLLLHKKGSNYQNERIQEYE